MKTIVVIFSLLIFFGVMVASSPVLAASLNLKAKKVAEGPVIDGKPDKIWNKVRPLTMKLVDGEQGDVNVSAKALYTDTDLYLLFRWKDKTFSANRVYEFTGTEWKKREGNEDRLGIIWDINDNITDFKQKGCSILCHDQGEYMKTNAPGQAGDVWHWKAQRSNPVGYADDQVLLDVKKQKGDEITGRVSDKKESGGYSSNWDKEANWPKYAFKDKSKSGSMLIKAEAVKISKDTSFAKGTFLPREVLERPRGSRGDISAKGIWKKGTWTLEIKRALKTGHSDDVQFDTSKKYHFAMSVFDNDHGGAHAMSEGAAYILIFN